MLSLAQNVPGPLAVSHLVAAGATATKIEPPGGDPLATFSPRWYRRLHRGVAIVRLDLKSDHGQARLQRLLRTHDLLLTSQRPTALARLGLVARRLARDHPHLRWLNIIGELAEPERPGHDLTYQASAGLLGREMPRALLADVIGAERAVTAVLLLLLQAPPCRTAVGLRDGLAPAALAVQLGLTGPSGVLGGALPTYRIYETRAGRVAVAALEPHFGARLYAALGLEPGTDLEGMMRTRTASQWERWAATRDLPLVHVADPQRDAGR